MPGRGISTADPVSMELAIAACARKNNKGAKEALAKLGYDATTEPYLDYVRRQHAAEIETVRRGLAQQVDQWIADERRSLALELVEIQREAAEATMRAVREHPELDHSKTIQNLSLATSQAIHDTRLIEEKPTAIKADRSLDEIINALRSLDKDLIQDDIPEATVVEQ